MSLIFFYHFWGKLQSFNWFFEPKASKFSLWALIKISASVDVGKSPPTWAFFLGITWDFLHRGHDRIVGCNEVMGRNNPIVITLTGSDEIRVKRDAIFDEDKKNESSWLSRCSCYVGFGLFISISMFPVNGLGSKGCETWEQSRMT